MQFVLSFQVLWMYHLLKEPIPKTDKEEIRRADVNDPFTALAFKITTDPYVGRLAFMRFIQVLWMQVPTSSTQGQKIKKRISRLYQMHANKQNAIERVEAGDIAAGVGFKDIRTGDTLCAEGHPIILESMVFPEP